MEIYKRFLEMPAPQREKYKAELEGIFFSGDFLRFIGMSQEERDLETKRKENLKAVLDKNMGFPHKPKKTGGHTMSDTNKAFIMGRLTRDAQLRTKLEQS